MSLKKLLCRFGAPGLLVSMLIFPVSISAQASADALLDGVEVGGMLRVRPDFLWNRNFVKKNDISYFNEKVWITVGKDFSPYSKLFFRIQDARKWGSYLDGRENGMTTSTEYESLDLREAYMLIGDMFDGNLAVQLGRMRLMYGDQRLVGSLDWTDIGRSFDGMRLIAKPVSGNQLDAWVALMTEGDAFLPEIDHIMFSGIYDTMKFSDDLLMDVYLLNKMNMDDLTAMDLFTFGARFTNRTNKGKSVSPLDWTVEGAYQFGDYITQSVSAYAVALVVGYTVNDIVRIGVEGDLASGDQDAGDGVYGTFSNLIPTNHMYYGQADFISWQNMWAANANVTLFPGKPFQAKLGYWYASRLSENDAWYGVAGAPSSLNVSSSTDLELFHELDLTLTYKPYDFLTLEGGFSMVVPGAAPVSVGADTNFFFGYLSSTVSF